MTRTLQLQKPKPGDAVVRFGDWRKREPQVTMDRQQWASTGAPQAIDVQIDPVTRYLSPREAIARIEAGGMCPCYANNQLGCPVHGPTGTA